MVLIFELLSNLFSVGYNPKPFLRLELVNLIREPTRFSKRDRFLSFFVNCDRQREVFITWPAQSVDKDLLLPTNQMTNGRRDGETKHIKIHTNCRLSQRLKWFDVPSSYFLSRQKMSALGKVNSHLENCTINSNFSVSGERRKQFFTRGASKLI